MSQFFRIHPETPQKRLIRRTAEILDEGGVIAYPTDSSYALGCSLGNKAGQDRIRRIRRLGERHNFTLMCRDLSDLGTYARVDNTAYRLLKALTPGPYTFILLASREVPRRLQNPRRKTIGLRVPDNAIDQALLTERGEPLMSTTLIPAGEEAPLTDAEEIRERLGGELDLVIDGGNCGFQPTTVVDLTSGEPVVTRVGKGDTTVFAA